MGAELHLREKVYHLQDRVRTLSQELENERVSHKLTAEELATAYDSLSDSRAYMIISFFFGIVVASIAWIVR